MNNGISVGNVGGVEINGVRCGLVSEHACNLASGIKSAEAFALAERMSDGEVLVALKAARLLSKMRASGYSKEDARKAFVQKIVNEAQRVKSKATETVEYGDQSKP